MKEQVIEVAIIKLREGVSEGQLVAASKAFQSEFLNDQPGFISRDLVSKGEGLYGDIVRWENQQAASAIMEKLSDSSAVAGYFSLMDMEAEDPAAGVSHYRILDSYEQG